MSDLPQGWVETTFLEIFDHLQYGLTAKADSAAQGTRFLRITDIHNGMVFWDSVPGLVGEYDLRRYLLADGDFVFARSGSIEKAARLVNPPSAVFASYLIRARPLMPQIANYLAHFVRSDGYLAQIADRAAGIGMSNVNASKLGTITVSIPPLPEQRRIVAKIDSFAEKSRRVRNHLDHIPRLVEKYKQAILAAAFDKACSFSGYCTELRELAVEVRNGLSKKPTEGPGGTKILRISSVRPCQVRFDDLRYYQDYVPETALLQEGDLLFTRYNGNPRYAAVCGCVRGLKNQITYPDKIIRVRLVADVEPTFVEIMCSTPQVRQWLTPYIKSAAGQYGISGKDLKRLPIPVPTVDQQREIIGKVHSAFSWIDRIAVNATSARTLLDRFDQAILAKAFRGELVPQDPNDEPASVLLERIRAERAKAPKPRRGRRKTA